MKINSSYTKYLWLLLVGLFVFLALNKKSKDKVYTYHSTFWADAAGYYVYVPAAFLYQFEARNFPDSVDTKTGFGFKLNLATNKVESKYAIGTALFEAPAFILTHTLLKLQGKAGTGFEKPYQLGISISAVLFFIWGLWLLSRVLLVYYSVQNVGLGLGLLVLGTNLYYYGIFMGGFSHVYSFFLFSAWLYAWQKLKNKFSLKYWLLIAALAGAIFLVRQLNILFLPLVLLIIPNAIAVLKGLNLKYWLIAVLPFLLVVAPQLTYNYSLHGSLVSYSYAGESFLYFGNPKLKEVWFAFENGWFTNNPIHLFTFLGMLILGREKPQHALGLWIAFLLVSYLYASWWSYLLGCAFGHRGFVDLYPYFAFGLVAFVHFLNQQSRAIRNLGYLAFFICIAFNLKLIYTYDTCWPTQDQHWRLDIFWHLLTSPPN
jgi:hypothetical protein